MSAEGWLPVVGWEGMYDVSDCGRVRSLPRTTDRNGHGLRISGRILRPGIAAKRGGYPFVNLRHGSRQEVARVHCLVMRAFVGPTPDGMEVAHGDGNPRNAHLSNLRYATPVQNHADKVLHGTHVYGSRHGQHILTETEVLEVVRLIDAGYIFRSIAEHYGVGRSAITNIHHGTTWSWLTGRSHQPRISRTRILTGVS